MTVQTGLYTDSEALAACCGGKISPYMTSLVIMALHSEKNCI